MELAWIKDVILPLLIAILAAAVGSGSVVLCGFLWSLITEWWQRSARRSALRARTASRDAHSGEQQPLPQALALHDIEMGPMNSGEVANRPHSSSPNDPNAAQEQVEMMHN